MSNNKPENVIGVFDAGDDQLDRYTIVLDECLRGKYIALGMSDRPANVAGQVFSRSEFCEVDEGWLLEGEDEPINWEDLPTRVQEHAAWRLK